MLVAGYGFGQGSIFLAQSWLLAKGQLELLALFGTHFAFAGFGIIVVEAGSLIILARHAASMERNEESVATMWRTFWELSVFRAVLALLVIAAGAAIAFTAAASPFTRAYALCAAPAFLFWALNAAGFLDGLRLSGISGVSGSLAYAASALALALAADADPATAGMVLGAAFSAGYLLTILVQFAALRVAGWGMRFERPRRAGILSAGRDGLALLGSNLPGQAYFRVQLLMSSAWLGAGPTALFVYVKQVVTAATQLAGFIRRVEFPALVQALAKGVDNPALTALRVQWRGTQFALALMLCLALAGLALWNMASLHLADVGQYMAGFSITIASGAVILALTQGLAALGRYNSLLVRAALSTAAGLAVSFMLVRQAGIYGFLIGDLASAVVSLVLLYRVMRYR